MCQKDMPGTIFNGLLLDIETLIHTFAIACWKSFSSYIHCTFDFENVSFQTFDIGFWRHFKSYIENWIFEILQFKHWTVDIGDI